MQLLFTGAFQELLLAQTVREQKEISVAAQRGRDSLWQPLADECMWGSISGSVVRASVPLQKSSGLLHPASSPSCSMACLICLTGNWITTRSAALKMGRSELYEIWKCCEYCWFLSLFLGASSLESGSVMS